MTLTKSPLQDCFILEPSIFNDSRGYFFESYNSDVFQKLTNINVNFVQDNESFSSKNVLRGLHFQKGIHAQSKLIRVISGEILDVVVDLRSYSPTYLKHFTVKISSDNKKQVFVPKHFAHGFLVLSDTAIINYKCDNFYNKESESGIIFNDTALNINWGITENELIISDKDRSLPTLKELELI